MAVAEVVVAMGSQPSEGYWSYLKNLKWFIHKFWRATREHSSVQRIDTEQNLTLRRTSPS